jgi:hypothetical protein
MDRWGRVPIALGALSACLLLSSFRQEATPALAIGPLRVGMSANEVREAFGDVAWSDDVKTASGQRRTMTAPDALTFAGHRYDLKIDWDYNSAFYADAVRSAGSLAPELCEQAALETMTTIETEFGSLKPTVAGRFLRDCFNSDDMSCARSIRTIGTPGGSVARRLSMDKNGKFISPRNLQDRRIHRHGLFASFEPEHGRRIEVYSEFTNGSCDVHLRLQQDAPLAPTKEIIDPANLRFLRSPSLGARHNAAIQLTDLATKTVGLRYDCSIDRKAGWSFCNRLIGGARRDPVADIARQVADQHIVDVSGIDPDSPNLLNYELTLTFSVSDLIPLSFDKSEVLNLGDIPGVMRAPGRTLTLENVANEIVAKELVTPGMEFGIYCQVQPDRSLACALPEPNSLHSPLLTSFALGEASRTTMPATLQHGGSSIGETVRVTIEIEVQGAAGEPSEFIRTR